MRLFPCLLNPDSLPPPPGSKSSAEAKSLLSIRTPPSSPVPEAAHQRTKGEHRAMDGGDSSPVMTDSERRAYRYGNPAAPRLRGMRKSWSNDSLAGYGAYGGGGRASCVCAPTTHPGSFRCKHHRNAAASNLGASAAAQQVAGAPAPDADAKHHEHHETAPTAYQADKSP